MPRLPGLIKRAKGVIFDIDGTIADSMGFWKELDNMFMRKVGKPVNVPETTHEECAGMSLPEIVERFTADYDLNISIEQGLEIFDSCCLDYYEKEVPLKDGVLDFMHYLRSRAIPFGFSTAISPAYVRALQIRHPTLKTLVGETFTTTCMVNKGKPAPDVYLHTARKMCVAPDDCVVFEDTFQGVEGAKNAGMAVVGVRDRDNLGRRADIEAVADGFIESWGHLLEELETFE